MNGLRDARTSRSNGWWISPVIPMVANALLAALWAFSAYGGWGETAFCTADGGTADAMCAAGFRSAVQLSLVLAIPAALLALSGWVVRAIRRRADRLDFVLTVAAFGWAIALGILFVGGYLAQS